jgi:hypothetical protein
MVNKSKTRRGGRGRVHRTSAAEPAEHEVPAVPDQQDSTVPPECLEVVGSPTGVLENKLVQLREKIYVQSMRLPHDSFTQSSYESCLDRSREGLEIVTIHPRQAPEQVRVTMWLPCDRFRIVKVKSMRTNLQVALEAASLCNWCALQSPSLLIRSLLA